MSEIPKNPSRRDFLKLVGAASLGSLVAEKSFGQTEQLPNPAEIYALVKAEEHQAEIEKRINFSFKHENPNENKTDYTPENLLARVMVNEEKIGDFKKYCHLHTLIAFTILNRLPYNWQNLTQEELGERITQVITRGNGFGIQGASRPYASVINPQSIENGNHFIALAKVILAGKLNQYNHGQTHFFHPRVQDKAYATGQAEKDSSAIIKERQKDGLTEIVIPGINRNYIKFFGPEAKQA